MNPTILLVDDEKLVREELGGFLEDEDYTVITASDGEEGLQIFIKHRPDMVITDARMPKREGLSLAKAILEENDQVPITMITGHGSEDMAIAALRLGITDFIKKPVQVSNLLTALERMKGVIKLSQERTNRTVVLPASARLVRSSYKYQVSNELSEIHSFISIVIREIASDLDNRKRYGLQLALREIMFNAVEHGNLAISYNEKTQATELGTMEKLIAQRVDQSEFVHRAVRVETIRTKEKISITVEDEGNGFDWRKLPDPTDPENLLKSHGRGVFIAHLSVDELTFNETGNLVTLISYIKKKK